MNHLLSSNTALQTLSEPKKEMQCFFEVLQALFDTYVHSFFFREPFYTYSHAGWTIDLGLFDFQGETASLET